MVEDEGLRSKVRWAQGKECGAQGPGLRTQDEEGLEF